MHRMSQAALLAVVAVLATLLSLGPTRATPARASEPGVGAPSPVYRYWNATYADWRSVPVQGSQPDPAQLAQQGYGQYPTPQFYVDMIGNDAMVAVYRWWQPDDEDWVDVVEGQPSDDQMRAWGYTSRTFQWYAYATPQPDTVAVYRWWQPTDRDWVTLRDQEIPDATMRTNGYVSKTFLFYASAVRSPDGGTGYFPLGPVQSSVLDDPAWAGGAHPHTFSVQDVNPTGDPGVNQGHRYLGYVGTNDCAGIGIARSDDLNATKWTEDTAPLFSDGDRWASTLVDDGRRIDLVDNVHYCSANYGIVGRVSTDGLNGTRFTAPRPLVQESDHANGNPTLFRDPASGRVYLYWWRQDGASYDIRVKSAATFDDLLQTSPTDIGQRLVYSPERIAAPQVMVVDGTYELAVESYESGNVWKTRVLTSASPTGPFFEIPGNPVYGDGSACVFQQVFGSELHSYYCHQATAGDDSTWTLDHVSADLTGR